MSTGFINTPPKTSLLYAGAVSYSLIEYIVFQEHIGCLLVSSYLEIVRYIERLRDWCVKRISRL